MHGVFPTYRHGDKDCENLEKTAQTGGMTQFQGTKFRSYELTCPTSNVKPEERAGWIERREGGENAGLARSCWKLKISR